jgi:hypothetical protein
MKLGLGMSLAKQVIAKVISTFNQLLSSTGEILKDSDGKNLGGA